MLPPLITPVAQPTPASVSTAVLRPSQPLPHWLHPSAVGSKAIREALGMSTTQLAKRARISQPSIVAMEQSEAKSTIELATLKRIAEALDCQLVYALVPNTPLEQMVRNRARIFARRRHDPIEHSMVLEDQQPAANRPDAVIDGIIRDTSPPRLWVDP